MLSRYFRDACFRIEHSTDQLDTPGRYDVVLYDAEPNDRKRPEIEDFWDRLVGTGRFLDRPQRRKPRSSAFLASPWSGRACHIQGSARAAIGVLSEAAVEVHIFDIVPRTMTEEGRDCPSNERIRMPSVNVERKVDCLSPTGVGTGVLLLHSVLTDSRVWARQFEGLSDQFTLIAWDAPGSGK